MAQIDYIKDLYENEDLSLREISRRTGHSFQTVQKYAYLPGKLERGAAAEPGGGELPESGEVHPQHRRVDGVGPEAAEKAAAHSNADLPPAGG